MRAIAATGDVGWLAAIAGSWRTDWRHRGVLAQETRGAAGVLLGEDELPRHSNRRGVSQLRQTRHVLRDRLLDEAPGVQVSARLRQGGF